MSVDEPKECQHFWQIVGVRLADNRAQFWCSKCDTWELRERDPNE